MDNAAYWAILRAVIHRRAGLWLSDEAFDRPTVLGVNNEFLDAQFFQVTLPKAHLTGGANISQVIRP